MARLLRSSLAVGALLGHAQALGFVPFADVDELKPQALHKHCGPVTPGQGPDGKLRWCTHSFNKTLEDEGTVYLHWEMHADPDSILNLDTEAEHGVKLTRCSPGELELELPESHATHAAVGQVIVGSRFVHNCEHLENHLYHKVASVHQHQWQDTPAGRRAVVILHTEELGTFAKAVPFFHLYFEYMPIEARETVEFPEMRTDYGLNRKFLEMKKKAKEEAARAQANSSHRQLGLFSSLLNMGKKGLSAVQNMDGASQDMGGFQSGGHNKEGMETENSLFNLMPKQMSNFGWNWNFFLNEEQEPKYVIKGPGTKGIVVLKKPYVKVHSGIFLNHTSKFNGFSAPSVKWQVGMASVGTVKGRLESGLDTTGTAGFDPIESGQEHNLPFLRDLERFEKPLWFKKIDIAAGGLPISMEPGFQLTGSLYHSGVFKGALAFGGKTRGHVTPILHYDSVKGFDTTCTGELYDTEIWPPLWLIFTKQFEIGIQLKPTILLRGDFASIIDNGVMAIELRPYINVTVTREEATGAVNYSSAIGGSGLPGQKPLTVYPFRVMGLDNMDFHRRYQVQITGNGRTVTTSPEINWGHVHYHGRIENFDLGFISQEAATNQQFSVTLLEIDDSNGRSVSTVLGTGTVSCTSILNGACEPTPNLAHIKSTSGTEIAVVQLAIDWDDAPEPWFATKIKGVSISFPNVAIREDVLQSTFPGSTGNRVLHLRHGGMTYVSAMKGVKQVVMTNMIGDTTVELGPSFIQTWEPCEATGEGTSLCDTPKLELWEGFLKIAEADFPRIDWNSQTAMQGTQAGGFLAGAAKDMKVPITVALHKPGDPSITLAVARLTATIVPPSKSSIFMEPMAASSVTIGQTLPFKWTIAEVNHEQIYNFRLEAMRLAPSGDQANPAYRKVDDKMLVPVAGSQQVVETKCKSADLNAISSGSAACTFEHLFPFTSPTFQMGEQIVVLVEWMSDGTTHVMYSPPFEVAGIQRRLSVGPEATPRQLDWKGTDWKARVAKASTSESCKARDLHFKIGKGILFRGSIESMGMPAGFPMLSGGGTNGPEIATAWRRIGGAPHNRTKGDLQDYLPKTLCKTGICSGGLPGCNTQQSKELFFPKIVINVNRTATWQELEGPDGTLFPHLPAFVGKSVKPALTYAFAALPEMVELGMKENENFNRQKKLLAQNLQATQQQAAPAAAWWTPSPAPAATPAGFWNGPAPVATNPPASQNAGFNNWWNSGPAQTRRLAELRAQSSEPVGSYERVPEVHELQGHQVSLTWKTGIPFVIDRPLINMMLQNGYFQDLEDEHGPLAITGFFVNSGHPISVDEEQGRPAPAALVGAAGQEVPEVPEAAGPSVVAGVAVLAVAAMAVGFRRWKLQADVGGAEPSAAE